MRALSIGASGMLAQQTNVEVISNNIANMNTTGYQRRRVEFQDLLYQNQRRVGSPSSDNGTVDPVGIQIGLGVRTAGIYRITAQGNLSQTENTLDLAINGEGYFQVELPNGETAYTRDGSFQLNQDGNLVTVDGFTVQPGITIPANAIDVTINRSGQVLATIDGQVNAQNVGQLELATFPNDAGLEALGGNFFQRTQASGDATTAVPASNGFGFLLQGFLETSNVNVVQEITQLISAQRAFEMNSKVIQTADQIAQTTSQIR